MPRPNPNRTLQSEVNLARRIAHERERLGWTYEGTAKRLTDVGCPIQPSAIYKIEKSDPPRRISVDELVAFAKVFEVSVEELLLPVEVAEVRALAELFLAWDKARQASALAKVQEEEALAAVRQFVAERGDEMTKNLHAMVEIWVKGWVEDDAAAPTATAYWMFHIDPSPRWSTELDDLLDRRAERRQAEQSKRKGKARG